MRMESAICLAATLLLCGTAGMANAAYITIGNAGNADGTSGLGGVSYEYEISDTEVTIAEFSAFTIATGVGGNENYWNDGTRTVGTAAPATYVSVTEAMRYCNYLTSGNVNNGAYVLSLEGAYLSVDRASAISTYGTVYALPTEDEWYKAAFFKPDASGYSLYAHGTNTAPVAGTDSNYGYAVGATTWVVGAGTVEQNGTYDMMGNVWEWTEIHAIRGAGFKNGAPGLLASYPGGVGEYDDVGFRVVVVPEPATIGLMGIAGLGLFLARKKTV